uniref:Uncharacterized protein n=1 Tax=Anguilla anguilla TaxID=7936 RepID=A0A0E9SG13_ANGAN
MCCICKFSVVFPQKCTFIFIFKSELTCCGGQ